MFLETIYITIAESYILSVMGIFTIGHIVLTQFLKSSPISENSAVISTAFYLMFFCMIALPIAALYSKHYWIFISLSTIFMVGLFLSTISHSDRLHPGNTGSIAFLIFPMFYFPALLISMIVH